MPPSELMRALTDLALPRRCGGCDAPGAGVCPDCAAQLAQIRGGEPFPAVPTPCPPGCPTVWASTAYEGAPAAMLRAYKDAGRGDLGRVLAPLLRAGVASAITEAVQGAAPPTQVVIVPVPSSARARRSRGREPLTDLTREALRGQRTVRAASLLTVGRVRDQAGLTATDRAVNLHGAMRVRHGIRPAGVTCVVVDDIMTTGATLTEAARVLRDAGACDVIAAVIAATRRRVPEARDRRR